MKLCLVTVAFDPVTGMFPREPLEDVEGEVLSVVEHFFHHAGLPHLLLVVHHRPSTAGEWTKPAQRAKRIDPSEALSEEDRRLYEALRAWRVGRADTDGVPVYLLFNNRQLAEMAKARPKSLKELRAIEGIGEGKAGRYGKDVLDIVTERAGLSGASRRGE